MPTRLDDFNKKFVYTETNPEGIISAKKDALFFRSGNDFFINYDGNVQVGPWEKLNYRTVIIPPPPLTKEIKYKRPHEIWIKTTDGLYDEFGRLMPKTGWKIFAYKDAFAMLVFRTIKWIFPAPTSSYDPAGVDGNRSYDNNYFYAKVYGKWYRTPITLWTDINGPIPPDDPDLTTYLPYVDLPRAPLVSDPYAPSRCSQIGDQTYDKVFFYIKINSTTWKRSRLNIYKTVSKMALF